MKNKILKIKIFIIVCFLFACYYTREHIVHIYFDKASNPTLIQMVDFVKRKDTDIKIVHWERINAHIKNKQDYKNVFFTKNEHSISSIVKALKLHLFNVKVVIHLNMHQDYFLNRFVEDHGKRIIKEIHLYEDSPGYFWETSRVDYLLDSFWNIKKIIHLWGASEKLCETPNSLARCNKVKEIMKRVTVEPVDFYEMEKRLSLDEKKKIFNLVGYDYDDLSKLFLNKKTVVYTLGCNVYKSYKATQIVVLKRLCQNSVYKNYNWFYKNHPTGYCRVPDRTLKALCPNIKALDAHVPFEVLILGGLAPTKIAGSGSGIFFSFKKDDVLAYVARENKDPYLSKLKKVGILTDKEVYTISDAEKMFEELNIFSIKEIEGYQRYLLQTDEKTVLDMFGSETGEIIEATLTQKIIKFKTRIVTIVPEDDYRWNIISEEKI